LVDFTDKAQLDTCVLQSLAWVGFGIAD
jgi:hypothetical protein